jgi:NADPH:quinone reductase-like Zn-dependent oxidoreductase
VACAFGGPEVLELAEVERPAPISTEVLVRVRYAGVNPVDLKTRSGRGVASVGEPPSGADTGREWEASLSAVGAPWRRAGQTYG